eukprot:TRINITY_DN2174_c0_g1_i3.p2 TRINITY_DN2174_c0_g1~~TRINITY_DN2174_c0_g1_i3.p2  ORF type:complete len:207 (-),score=87.29 TRINITY_DN2174_c0_g1_i3:243-863(-)
MCIRDRYMGNHITAYISNISLMVIKALALLFLVSFASLGEAQQQQKNPFLNDPIGKFKGGFQSFNKKSGLNLPGDSVACFDRDSTLKILGFVWQLVLLPESFNPAGIVGLIMSFQSFIDNFLATKKVGGCVVRSKDLAAFVARFKLAGHNLGQAFGRIRNNGGKRVDEFMSALRRLKNAIVRGDMQNAGAVGSTIIHILLNPQSLI